MFNFDSFGWSSLLGWGRWRATPAPSGRVGLYFGPAAATLVRLGKPDASQAATIEFAQRVEVEGGRRPELARRWFNAGRLRDASSVVVLAPGEYDTLQLAAPTVPDDELRDALRWQLRGTLPYSVEEAAIDFVRVPESGNAPPRPTLFVVAAPKSTVARAVAPLLEVGAQVTAVDVPEFAQRNLDALNGPIDDEASTAWLGFETNACLLTVQCGQELTFARRIPITDLSADSEGDNLVAYLSDRVATQVQRSLDLYERQSGHQRVRRLLLSQSRNSARFARELAARTVLEARVFDPGAALHLAEPAGGTAGWTHDHLWALGGALRPAEQSLPAALGPSLWLNRLARKVGAVATQ